MQVLRVSVGVRSNICSAARTETVAPYAESGEVHLRITAKAGTVAGRRRLIDGMDRKLVRGAGRECRVRRCETLERVVVEGRLIERGLTISIAEEAVRAD